MSLLEFQALSFLEQMKRGKNVVSDTKNVMKLGNAQFYNRFLLPSSGKTKRTNEEEMLNWTNDE